MKALPPAPAGWNKTIADLMAELESGGRSSLGSPELDWARAYERSLLPPGTRFPRKGDVYESLEDVELNYLTAWLAPFTGGGKAILPKGQRLLVSDDPGEPEPISIYADAVSYRAMEELMVPAEERSAPKYNGFYFSVATRLLNAKFHLVSSGPSALVAAG